MLKEQHADREVLLWWGKEEYAEHRSIGSQPVIQNDLHAHPNKLNTTFGRALEGDKNDIQYFHKNYLEHVYAVSDDGGNVIEHYRYTAFGEPEVIAPDGQQLATSAIGNDIMWNVKRYDSDSGLCMYMYRHYDTKHGRWPSRDPIEEDGGGNLYVFVGSDGLNKIDAFGLAPATLLTQDTIDLLCDCIELTGSIVANNFEGSGVSSADFPEDGGTLSVSGGTFTLTPKIKNTVNCRKCKSYVVRSKLFENGLSIETDDLTVGSSTTITTHRGGLPYGSNANQQFPLSGRPPGTTYELRIEVSSTHHDFTHDVTETECLVTTFTLG